MSTRRRFALDDQRAFAALSGDWNPLHVDPVAARRLLFGEPVVHGLHLVLWGLDRMCTERPFRSVRRLHAVFRRPCSLDRDVDLELSGGHAIAKCGDAIVLDLAIEPGEDCELGLVVADREFGPTPPHVVRVEDVAACRGDLEPVCDRRVLHRLFPALETSFSIVQTAELLATTRIVGMRCPGMHSIFSRLTLEFAPGGATVTYRVSAAVMKYSSVQIAVAGPTLVGTLETFYRPQPSQIDMAHVASRVRPGALASQRALVVGGSRGLGEAFAKVIGASGGRVVISYRTGANDAARVCREIGDSASSIELDVTHPFELELPWQPTHVYYFATPKIRIARDDAFSDEELGSYFDYFVYGLLRSIRAVHRLGGNQFVLWAPSTSFLDHRESGTAAYCSAKAAMEELGRHLPRWWPVIVAMPRLPRAATDQTASLIPIAGVDPVELAIKHLGELPRAGSS